MLVVRQLSAGVRGRCGQRQGQQKGGRYLSGSTGSSNTNGEVYWGRQWEKAKEAAPVVLSVIGFVVVISEGTRLQVEARTKLSMQETILRLEQETKQAEQEINDAVLRRGMAKKQAEQEKKDAVLRGELEKKDAVLRGEMEKKYAVLRGELGTKYAVLRGELEKKDALRAGQVDGRILDLLTQGDYERARILLKERANGHVTGLPSSPPAPPPPPT